MNTALEVEVREIARREAIALNTTDGNEAAKMAAQLYSRIRAIGWEATLRDFDLERHAPKSDATVGDAITALGRADL
jgi:hypothetical protein